MKKHIMQSLVAAGLLLSLKSTAQIQGDLKKQALKDSLKRIYLTEAAIGNPLLRQVTISTDIIGKQDFHSDMNDSRLLQGKVKQQRTNVLVNLPIASWGKNSISASLSAFQQHITLSDIQSSASWLTDYNNKTIDKLTVGFSGSYTRAGTIFGRPAILSGSITGLTGKSSSIQKMSYTALAVFPLKQTLNSRSSLGLIVLIDPAVQSPVIPVFSYWHKYASKLELNINIPQQISVRKPFGNNLYGTLGTYISGTTAFYHVNQPGLPSEVNQGSGNLKTGPGLEYRIGKFMIGVNGGVLTTIQDRIYDTNKTVNDYFISNHGKSTAYINFRVSLLPFLFTH